MELEIGKSPFIVSLLRKGKHALGMCAACMLILACAAAYPALAQGEEAPAPDSMAPIASDASTTPDPSQEPEQLAPSAEDDQVSESDNASETDPSTTPDNTEADSSTSDANPDVSPQPEQPSAPEEDSTASTVDENIHLKDGNGEVITGEGWHRLNEKWYHTDADGVLSKGFIAVNDKKYYLDPDTGSMRSGWQKVDDKWYYLGSANDGSMKTGWLWIGSWYYLDPDTGAMASGFAKVGAGTYYLGGADDGSMKSGWQKVDDKWYYLGSANDGSMKTGWLWIGSWYYLDPDTGAMAYGLTPINGKMYYLGGADDGSMKSGWQKVDDRWYHFGSANDGSMKTGWLWSGCWYYLDPDTGAMAYGLTPINGKMYYLGGADDGAMKSGWAELTVDNEKNWYFFNGQNDGSMRTGWVSSGGVWYYLDPSTGIMVTKTKKTDEGGTLSIDGVLYAFADSGAMLANARHILADGSCGYAAPSGAIARIGIFDGENVILKNEDETLTGWQRLNGAWFFANGEGVVQTGWLQDGGFWYYLQPSSGAMATGSCKVDGAMEYFEASGAWSSEKSAMSKRAQGFSSPTGYLILVDTNACRMGVFSGSWDNWSLIRYESCVCGAPGSPTIQGTYSTGYHLDRLPSWPNALNCTNIWGEYFFHSILNSTSELGQRLSHGCVRLNWPTASYIQTLPYGSTVNLY